MFFLCEAMLLSRLPKLRFGISFYEAMGLVAKRHFILDGGFIPRYYDLKYRQKLTVYFLIYRVLSHGKHTH